MPPNNNIGQMMAEHFYQSQIAIQEVEKLKQQVNELQQVVTMLKQSDGDQGWMAITKAAPLVGMASNSLGQRFRRGVYPEGVVWAMENNRYIVNLRALRQHMAGNHS